MGAGHHTNCKNWDYATHPSRADVSDRCAWLWQRATTSPRTFDRFGYDTRKGHALIFRGLAPDDCQCIVGNYRGTSGCAALTASHVGVGADPRVGVPPQWVALSIKVFEQRCDEVCSAFQANTEAPERRLVAFATLLAELLTTFLGVHPYANGNGHAARLLVCVLMTRHGFQPKTWPIDDRPPYGPALSAHRDGNPKPLITLILRAMRGQKLS